MALVDCMPVCTLYILALSKCVCVEIYYNGRVFILENVVGLKQFAGEK